MRRAGTTTTTTTVVALLVATTKKKRGLVLGPTLTTTVTNVQHWNVSKKKDDFDGQGSDVNDDDANDTTLFFSFLSRPYYGRQPKQRLLSLLETTHHRRHHHRGGRGRHDQNHAMMATLSTTNNNKGMRMMMKMASNKNLSTKTNEEEREKGDEHQRRRRRVVLCWSCGEPLKKNTNSNDDDDDCKRGGAKAAAVVFFCKTCDAVVHPSSISTLSHYALLDAPETFAVDAKALETTMKGLQKKLHPDAFAGRRKTREATEDRAREKEYSEALSARVNEAYGKLRDPLSRAKYLFALKSGATSVDDEEEDKKEEDTWGDEEEDENGERKRETVSPELLFLVMDVREAIEDAGEDVEALMKLKEENEERVEEATTRVGEALDDETTFDKEKARKAIVELTYYERIRKEIIERL